MGQLVGGRTALVIAHRLETLANCDDIAVLEHGELIEYGTRVALAADPTSHYARILRVGHDAEELQ
jgi:ABC-type multidrug transport system fused ATPase/permease subunit